MEMFHMAGFRSDQFDIQEYTEVKIEDRRPE